MASKVLLNIQVAPFSQISKSNGNTVTGEITVGRNSDKTSCENNLPKGKDAERIVQLEQNIRFLQDQHTQMLAGLHKEIDNLRHKNRELQFQLVFNKGGIPSSPSSPEDDTKPKVYYSPKQVNITPLQVEILEKEVGELKLQLQKSNNKNAHLSVVVDEQKKKLESYEHELEKAAQPDPELLQKIEESETLIYRLRKENSELRQDNKGLANSSNSRTHGNDGHFQRGSQNRSGRHRGNSAGHYRGNWFPPLNTSNYWNDRKMNDNREGSSDDNGTPLPSLTNNTGQYQHNKRGSNNNHYRHNEGRVFRSGGPKPS